MAVSPSQYVQQFQTSEVGLSNLYKATARQMAFTGETKVQAVAWQRRARKQFAQLLGLDRFTYAPAKPRKLEGVIVDGLTRELWHIQTEPGVWMPFYLFIPEMKRGERLPLVLCPHGHASAGKWATAGRRDIPEMKPVIETYNYDYGIQIAKAGFITACMDARGFGERREPLMQDDKTYPDWFRHGSCSHLSLAGAPLGIPVQGMWTWDLMRLIDHLSEDKRVDAERIGSAGLSGGGLQTLDVAAIDTRIKAAVDSGYFYGVRESLQVLNANCMCNMVPHLWEYFDMGDIGALVAPRGLFIETGDQDPLNGPSKLKNVRSQVAMTKKVYDALGAAGQLQHHIFKGEHLWNGTRAIPWLQQQLQS